MSTVKRSGNVGIVDMGEKGMASFSIGSGWSSPSFSFSSPDTWSNNRQSIGNYKIIPYGNNNDLPNELRDILDNFYSGEGILGKIQGLQWGEGPRLYREEYNDENNEITRKWVKDAAIENWLESWNYEETLLRCLVDLAHLNGYFYKIYRNKGVRLGESGKIVRFEHVSIKHARLEAPAEDSDYPARIIVGDYPYPRFDKVSAYPIWNQNTPFQHAVAMGYQNIYSFCKDFYSTPRFYGALSWITLASSIAPLLKSYNKNSSAISYHIESPSEYWDDVETKLKEDCTRRGIAYSNDMLEEYKDKAFAAFAENLTGEPNAGKYFHSLQMYNEDAGQFQGWKVIALDKKIKDYIDAQISIANKADSAATSGFGLHPSLSNIMVDGKLASGSEQLYALKVYMASETAIPEMILLKPVNAAIRANFNSDLKLGFYRKIVMKESEVAPKNRTVNNT